ncbi:MAG: hypothetical protein EA371_01310, partial [Gammaproteobacteria bacterium]
MTHQTVRNGIIGVGLFCIISLAFAPWSAGQAAHEPIPMQAWVHDPILASVQISPDGRHIVAVSPQDLEAVPQLTIWDVENLGAPPRRIDLVAGNRSRWKPVAAAWLNNEQIYVVGQQLLDVRVSGRTILTFNTKAFVYHMGRDRLAEPFGGGGTRLQDLVGQTALVDRMPMDDDRVLVSQTTPEGATNLYEMRLDRNYTTRRIFRGAPGASAFPDWDGNVRGRVRFEDRGGARLEVDVRPVDANEWQTIAQFLASDREGLQPIGFARDPDVFFMTDNG